MSKETPMLPTDEIDAGKVRALQRQINKNSDLIDGVVSRLVSNYCEPLDEYMLYVQGVVSDAEVPPTDAELDQIALRLPVLLYFTGEGQESLGIKEDMAKSVRQELYSESYNRAVGTVGDKTAAAELATQDEALVMTAYQRAYKKIKLRMELASEMLQSVKKVMSRRMSEYELSRVDPNRIGGN